MAYPFNQSNYPQTISPTKIQVAPDVVLRIRSNDIEISTDRYGSNRIRILPHEIRPLTEALAHAAGAIAESAVTDPPSPS